MRKKEQAFEKLYDHFTNKNSILLSAQSQSLLKFKVDTGEQAPST
jgi:hypothetical protein